jgi:hypothetical protein
MKKHKFGSPRVGLLSRNQLWVLSGGKEFRIVNKNRLFREQEEELNPKKMFPEQR